MTRALMQRLIALAKKLDATMVLDYNNALANAALNAIYDTNFPAGSIVEIRTGAPAGAENAAGGSLLASITTPAGPWAAAAAGSKAKAGVWQDAAADAAGTAGHFRKKNAAGTLLEEGTITVTGGGGDMTLDNIVIAINQVVTITGYTRTG